MRACRNIHLDIQGFALHTVRARAHDTKYMAIAQTCLLNTRNRPFTSTLNFSLVSFLFVLLLYCFVLFFFIVCVLQYRLETYICKEVEDNMNTVQTRLFWPCSPFEQW